MAPSCGGVRSLPATPFHPNLLATAPATHSSAHRSRAGRRHGGGTVPPPASCVEHAPRRASTGRSSGSRAAALWRLVARRVDGPVAAPASGAWAGRAGATFGPAPARWSRNARVTPRPARSGCHGRGSDHRHALAVAARQGDVSACRARLDAPSGRATSAVRMTWGSTPPADGTTAREEERIPISRA